MTDIIKEPEHYKQGAIEAIDVIEDIGAQYEVFAVGYAIGNALKYIQRAPHKGKQLQDLEKAKQYLSRAIACLEGRKGWD
jgi:poly(3-hydroxyalkanoate) synthetase